MPHIDFPVEETGYYDILWPGCPHQNGLEAMALVRGMNSVEVCPQCGTKPVMTRCPAPPPKSIHNGDRVVIGPDEFEVEHFHGVADALRKAAETFEERNKNYGDGYKRTGRVLAAMFAGYDRWPQTAEEWTVFHLFIIEVAKNARFVNSGLKHFDSNHDNIVYGAMIEEILGGLN